MLRRYILLATVVLAGCSSVDVTPSTGNLDFAGPSAMLRHGIRHEIPIGTPREDAEATLFKLGFERDDSVATCLSYKLRSFTTWRCGMYAEPDYVRVTLLLDSTNAVSEIHVHCDSDGR